MTVSTGDIDAAVRRGRAAPSPRLWKTLASPLTLSASFQRIDFSTLQVNEFPLLGAVRTVDWDAVNKLVTFNDITDRSYVAYFTLEYTLAGITLPPVLPPVAVQLRYTIPNGGGPGVDLHYPNHGAASGNEYMTFSTVLANGGSVDHHPLHFLADSVLRANGGGVEVRVSVVPLLATLTLAAANLYVVAS